jgi:transcriptional regulator with XRE-family HTH domain
MPLSKGKTGRLSSRAPKGATHDAAGPRREAGGRLGDRLRRLRRQRGWTLAQVSAKSGLAISTLSKVENNQIALTYHNLAKLAVGLDLDLADFFTPEAIGERSGRRRVCRRGEGRLHESANYAHEYLCAELSRRRMIPLYTRVKARSIETFGEPIQHPGEEFLFVLEGAIDLYIAPDPPVRLRAGDSCYFDGESGHAAVSVGVNDALILTVMSAPPHVRPDEVA